MEVTQPAWSVADTVYKPAAKLVADELDVPLLQAYVKVPVPPDTVVVITPVLSPKQLIL